MIDPENFSASTMLFNDQKFLQGLEQINKSLLEHPQNSVLYSNRALFLVEIGHVRQAIKDLKYSVELDNLNFVSYFNLSSIYVREGRLELALQELHCALSAMYIIAGKQMKSYEFVRKSIFYARNNAEARVLKGLLDLENGRFKEAHEEFVLACGIHTDSIMLAKVRDLVKKIGDQACKTQEDSSSSELSQIRQLKRLESAFKYQKYADIEGEIKDKIIEFNKMYKFLSKKEDLVTQKIWEKRSRKEVFLRQRTISSRNSSIQKVQQGRREREKEGIQMEEWKQNVTNSNQVIDSAIDAVFENVQIEPPQQNPEHISTNIIEIHTKRAESLKPMTNQQEQQRNPEEF